jgi:hypothetical protein
MTLLLERPIVAIELGLLPEEDFVALMQIVRTARISLKLSNP